jgi:sorting nexin-17
MNWHAVKLEVLSSDKSSAVLEKFCKSINMPHFYLPYFSLFMVRKDDNSLILLKKMMDFESPLLTLRNCNANSSNHYLVIRKSYWDPVYDEFLFDNKVALNLLYAQIMNDIEKNSIQTNKEVIRQLTTLQAKGYKKEVFLIVGLKSKQSNRNYFSTFLNPFSLSNFQRLLNTMVVLNLNHVFLIILSRILK